ncbi:fatty-acid amide hydrolase 2-like isoform X2 [Lycorma delicatula]|uniref:fatty-acid amide hydrolase 2-like isoform X2 n=1 Tax=Lycorma delicatula TaxID=130591 RepID=UPI003F50FD12
MEIGLRLLGAVQIFLAWITAPLYLLIAWKRGKKYLPPISDPILLHSATELAAKIRKEEYTCEQVVGAYIKRCRSVNPHLNAIVEQRFDEASKEAYEIDQIIASHTKSQEQLERETPLLGVPFTVKESCGLKGMSLSVGCKIRANIKAQQDGESVENLRKAGAIPIAVTNTPELCLCWETNNLLTGCTYNPYDFNRTPGGSSGGESALISSAASVAGIGSDIAGSVRIPSMFTGIFGHKPTPGYIGLGGHYPYAANDDFENFLCVGPMTRYAEDLKLLLKTIAGKNAEALKLDEKVNLKNLKIYYMYEAGPSLVTIPVDQEIKKTIHKAVEHFKTTHGCPAKNVKIEEMIDSVEISTTVFFGMEGIPQVMSMSNPDDPKKRKNVYVEIFKAMFGLSDFSTPSLLLTALHEKNCFIPQSKCDEYRRQSEDLHNKFKIPEANHKYH